MQTWEFQHPARILFGCGRVKDLGLEAKKLGANILLVTGKKSLKAGGRLTAIKQSLKKQELEVVPFDQVENEADIKGIHAGVVLARQEGINAVIGIGGGSVLDTAKAIAGLTKEKGDPLAYHGGGKTPTGKTLPWIGVPTTAGTGAEVTNNAVVSDYTLKKKESIRHPAWLAKTVILDPELTLSLSPEHTAYSGADALTQAIEAYVSRGANILTDALALQAMRLILPALPRVYKNGADLEAREAMLAGSLFAGLAFSHSRLGAVHGLAHPLGIGMDLPHGLLCGILLPYIMEFNLPACGEKFAEIERIIHPFTYNLPNEESARLAVDSVHNLIIELGLPENLSGYPKADLDIEKVVKEALGSGSMMHNPKAMTAADIHVLLDELFITIDN